MSQKPPELWELIGMIQRYYIEIVKRILKLGIDVVTFGDNLGLQNRMPISSAKFRKFIFLLTGRYSHMLDLMVFMLDFILMVIF